MEVDAFLIMVLSVYVARESCWWVLAMGLARYAFVAAGWVISVVVIKDRKVTEWRDYLDPLRVFAALDGRPFEPDGNAATDPGDG
jgi:hypothetical protein